MASPPTFWCPPRPSRWPTSRTRPRAPPRQRRPPPHLLRLPPCPTRLRPSTTRRAHGASALSQPPPPPREGTREGGAEAPSGAGARWRAAGSNCEEPSTLGMQGKLLLSTCREYVGAWKQKFHKTLGKKVDIIIQGHKEGCFQWTIFPWPTLCGLAGFE